jgi:hypothetical protein
MAKSASVPKIRTQPPFLVGSIEDHAGKEFGKAPDEAAEPVVDGSGVAGRRDIRSKESQTAHGHTDQGGPDTAGQEQH